MEISKNQVLKNALDEVMARTGMNKNQILKEIVNDMDSEKSGLEEFTNFLRGYKNGS